MFGLFVGCALLPVFGLSLIAWERVGSELEEQSHTRLHHAARRTGMLILDRLTSTTTSLGRITAGGVDDGMVSDLRNRIDYLDRVDAEGGAVAHVWGDLRQADLGRPNADAPMLESVRVADAQGADRVEVWLQVPVHDSSTIWRARLSPEYLFSLSHENVLSPAGEACISTVTGLVLWSSRPGLTCGAMQTRRTGTPELRTVEIEEDAYLALDWLLFLKAAFDDPGWTVRVAEPRSLAMGPVETFRELVLLVSALTLSLVALVSARQIRRHLEPLARLESAVDRVGHGDFGVSVPVETDDELGRVSQAFNDMSTHVGEAFTSMVELIEVDRGILASRTRDELARVALDAVDQMGESRISGLALSDVRGSNERTWTLISRRGGDREQIFTLDSLEITQAVWFDVSVGLLEPRADQLSKPLRNRMIGLGGGELEVYPLVVDRDCLGFVYRESLRSGVGTARDRLRLRQLCDQVAAAVHGLNLLRQNERLMRFDAQTGLPNRPSFEADIGAAIAECGDEAIGVAHISINGLHRIEAKHGTGSREQVIVALADAVRSHETFMPARIDAASFGGFVVAGDQADVASQLRAVIFGLRAALADRVGASGVRVVIGAAMLGSDGGTAPELMEKAEIAARHAAGSGPDSVNFFVGDMEDRLREASDLEVALSHAVDACELTVVYQPIVDAATLEIVAAEALVRWNDSSMGQIGPDVFIPLAEESGLIHELGDWVLGQVFADVEEWRRMGLEPVRTSINVSPLQVEGRLQRRLAALLSSFNVSPADFGIEITESATLGEARAADAVIKKVRELGMTVSIDDFGTGYSSLEYLRQFDADCLKIDRSFLAGVPGDAESCDLTRAAVAVARALRFTTIAEGCETEEQLAFLREVGCDCAQGYLIGKPMSFSDFAKRLEGGTAREV